MTGHQGYYLRQKTNAKLWQETVILVSAQIVLSENRDYQGHYRVFTAGNVKALGFFASNPIRRLAKNNGQLVMDSTFRTNNDGLDLFAVLAEVEGIDIPLAYCLVELLKTSERFNAKRQMPR